MAGMMNMKTHRRYEEGDVRKYEGRWEVRMVEGLVGNRREEKKKARGGGRRYRLEDVNIGHKGEIQVSST